MKKLAGVMVCAVLATALLWSVAWAVGVGVLVNEREQFGLVKIGRHLPSKNK